MHLFPRLHSGFIAALFLIPIAGAALLLASGSGSADQPSPSGERKGHLNRTVPVEAEITGQQIHLYTLEVSADDYLDAIAFQQGVDLRVRLLDPSGDEVIVVDSPNGQEGPERVEAKAEADGLYQLELFSQDEEASSGRYELRLSALRPATGDDRQRAEAAAAYARGDEDRRRGDGPSLRRAAESYETALALWREQDEGSRAVAALLRLGNVYRKLRAFDEAYVSLQRALPLIAAVGDANREAEVLNGLGLLHSQRREHERAAELHRRALALARSAGHGAAEAAALHNLASIEEREGRLFEAVDFYEQALTLWRALENQRQEAETLNSLGSLYSSLQEIERARSHFEHALELLEEIGDRRLEAVVLNNLGVLFDRAGELERAAGCFERVLALWQELAEPVHRARAFNNLGRVHRVRGAYGKAEGAYRRALELARQAGHRDVEAVALHNLAWLRDLLGDPAAALAIYADAQELFAELTPRRRATLLYGMARAFRSQGDLDGARTQVETALGIVREARSGIVSRSLRTAYFATRHDLYELYVDLLMQRHRDEPEGSWAEEAFDISQEARARGFLDALSESRAAVRRGADAGLLAEERGLQERINANDRQHRERIDAGASTEELAGLLREQGELLAHLEQVRTRIRLSTPQGVSWIEPLGLAEIRSRILDPETVLLHYELAEERSFVWVVTDGSVRSFELPGEDEVEELAEETARFLAQSHHRSREGSARWAAARLSRTILAPVEELLGRKRLVIVAEGALEYVSFAALPIPSTIGQERPEPLIAHHEIVRLPAVSILDGLRRESQPPPRRGRVAVLADPVFQPDDPRVTDRRGAGTASFEDLQRLPASRAEAEAILRRVSPQEGFLALGFQASRATVLSGQLRGYAIVHFATHGLVDPARPELSGIALSLVDEKGRPQDGFLRTYEILSLDLPAELVVLSACQTALGRKLDGEGLVGLSRAFLYAGARRLVLSLWRIDDEATAELMDRFYREMLVEGHAPAAALRQAQLALAHEERFGAPYYWAGFVLLGDWRPPPRPGPPRAPRPDRF